MKVAPPLKAYKSPFWGINGHLETIASSVFRKNIAVAYKKENFTFSDTDITQLNWLKNKNKKLIIIIPGLGSNATRNYVQNCAYYFSQNGYDILVPDHRDCGIPNKLYRSYHSSNYNDLHEVVSQKTKNYTSLFLIGFSLGGSIAMNYLARYQNTFTKSAIVSSPFDLEAGSLALEKKENFIYQRRFVKQLKEKLFLKHHKYPNNIDLSKIEACQTIKDVDECYTAPAHGFSSVKEYYTKSSSSQFIHRIKCPILTINAENDSFIPMLNKTRQLLNNNKHITNLHPKTGGHVAFPNTLIKGAMWHEKIILSYFNQL